MGTKMGTEEVKINKHLTAVVQESITGKGLVGYIKEFPECICYGITVESLKFNLVEAFYVYAKYLQSKNQKPSNI